MKSFFFAVAVLAWAWAGSVCFSMAEGHTTQPSMAGASKTQKTEPVRIKPVTFIELGSVNCIPCKMMQPVMEEIKQAYGEKVKVVFYDVWTPAGRPYGQQYKIRAIPTQVFLDQDGKEFFRHMGFFSKAEIAKVLEKQGVR